MSFSRLNIIIRHLLSLLILMGVTLSALAEVQLPAVTTFTYDDLGRIVENLRGGEGGTLTTDYTLHGSVSSISSEAFSQRLYYADGPGTPCWHSIPVRDIISYMRRVLPRPLFYPFLGFYFLTIPIWVIYWMIRGRNFYLYPALTEWGTKRNIEAMRKRISENLNRIDAQFKEWEKEYEPTPSDESGIPIISNRAFLINKETDE